MASQSMVFERPIGASADVKELEYIAALHQTDVNLRKDGSIKAIDIVHFLSSRYGIRVSVKEVQETILRGLGGGDDEEECIDLTEVAAILLIPELIKAARELLGEEDDGGLPVSREDFTSEREYKDHLRRYEISQARMPNPEIIGDVFDMILKDTFGSTSPRKLDRKLITDIFTAFGEEDLVRNGELIDEMMLVTSSSSGECDVEEDAAGATFDKYSFARALTSDVQDYSVNCETSLTTHYYDVFKTMHSTKQKAGINRSLLPFKLSTSKNDANNSGRDESEGTKPTDRSQNEPENRLSKGTVSSEKTSNAKLRPVEKVFTFPAIDYVAATYRSKHFVIALWVCGVATYFAYLYDFQVAFGRIDCSDITNHGKLFGCRILNGIINWLIIMLELSVIGSLFIIGGSIGNSTFCESIIAILIGMASISFFTVLPFFYELETPFFDTVHNDYDRAYQFLYAASLILGCLLLAMHGVHLLSLVIPKKTLAEQRWLSRVLTPQSFVFESAIKQAASLKVKKMMQNATAIHQSDDSGSSHTKRLVETSYGLALLNFDKKGEVYERVGGLWWTWTRMLNGTLYSEEGIFLNSQIMAGNTAQIVVCVFIFIAGVAVLFIETGIEEDDSASGPKKWMILLATLIGLGCGLFAAINIMLTYVPSSVSTIIKFRFGVIPSLQDKNFVSYRYSQDHAALLFGSIFWGSFYTSVAVAVLLGAVVFLAVWQVTSDFFLAMIAQIIGLFVTVGLKFLFLFFLRKQYFAAFYRKKPAQSNVLCAVLGCWNVALATGYVLVRGLMLLLAAAVHIGRIDVPFLAPEVKQFSLGCFSIDLDSYPTAYRKALLSSEAHRHPWIERLGSMYMMKLRHGDDFARTSGSVWRLLFVFALMPWLRKYRILARPDLQGDDEDYSHFKFGRNRMLPMRTNLTRRPGGIASGEDGALDEKDTDPIEEQSKVLKEENERLKREMGNLREQHERLLETMGLANANEAKHVIKV